MTTLARQVIEREEAEARAAGKLRPADKARIEGGVLLVRDWTLWDEEHPWIKKFRPHRPSVTPVGRPRHGKPGVDYPIHTADVDEAARLLGEGKKVELASPRQVSTLLDKLTTMVNEAVARGEKAPNYDLCLVSVPKTNLFCASSKGIHRIQMPQLSGKPVPGSAADKLEKDAKGEVDLAPLFRQHLAAQGHHVSDETELASYLKASQDELNGGKVAGMVRSLRAGTLPPGRIYTSNDNYIVDGHHRWAANVAEGLGSAKDMPMDIARVDMPIIELLAEANKFTEEMGLPHQARALRPVELLLRDWTKWDIERASLGHARRHMAEAAGRFHDEGGTIERIDSAHPEKLRNAGRELVKLHEDLVTANGGKPLPARVEKGFQLAQVAVSTPRAIAAAEVHIARTKEGHIAAVMATHPRPVLRARSHHLAIIGSTGITHGAGSALTQEAMRRAAEQNLPVTLVPYDPDAGQHWAGNLAAHEIGADMGWDPEEVKQLAKAA